MTVYKVNRPMNHQKILIKFIFKKKRTKTDYYYVQKTACTSGTFEKKRGSFFAFF